MILLGRMLCLPSPANVHELFSVARDASILPEISLDPVLTSFLSLDSSAALQHHFDFLQRGMSPQQQTGFSLNLTAAVGGSRVTYGGVGVVALGLSLLFDMVAQQVKAQRLAGAHLPTQRSKDKKRLGISTSSRIGWIIHRYLSIIPGIANNQDEMAESTELYDNWLQRELLDHYERMITKKRMSTESMQQWLTGAAFHLHMRIHQIRLQSVPLGSAESLGLSYKVCLNNLIKRYTSYLRTNIKEVVALPTKKTPTKADGRTKPTNTTRTTTLDHSNSLHCNISLVTSAEAVNGSRRINVTENRICETDSFVKTSGDTTSRNTTEGPGNSQETSTVHGSEEVESKHGLLIIEPQRNISHSVQHHPCESQAIQEALVVRIMNAQDLERNRNFFLYPKKVFHSLLRQIDDFELRKE